MGERTRHHDLSTLKDSVDRCRKLSRPRPRSEGAVRSHGARPVDGGRPVHWSTVSTRQVERSPFWKLRIRHRCLGWWWGLFCFPRNFARAVHGLIESVGIERAAEAAFGARVCVKRRQALKGGRREGAHIGNECRRAPPGQPIIVFRGSWARFVSISCRPGVSFRAARMFLRYSSGMRGGSMGS
jgi:hypothetical protein